jgi:hypothetical protein
MGISLKDFGDFAVGAIEQDKVNTKERFAIRAEELQANRASLIKKKDARYAKDIAAYDAEKKKYDTLKSAASNLEDGTINPSMETIVTIPPGKDFPTKVGNQFALFLLLDTTDKNG